MGLQQILDARRVQAQLVGQPRGLDRLAVEALRQLPQRPRVLDRHRNRFLGQRVTMTGMLTSDEPT
jgi:hypothetical protein